MATITSKHPFEIESVVDNLFNYLRLKDIIQHRVVCKLWHKIGTERLVNRIDEIRIVFGSNFSLDKPNPEKTVANFLQMQQNCSFKFTNFASFYFDGDGNLKGKIPKPEETVKLFDQCGLQMKTVKLDIDGKNCWSFLSDVLMTKAPNAEELHLHAYPHSEPILKKLFPHDKKPDLKLKTIILHTYDEFEDPIYDCEFLTELFQCSPRLERLIVELDMEQSPDEGQINHELLVLETLIDEGNISNLKELMLHVGDEDEFEILAENFKTASLEAFDLQIRDIYSYSKFECIQTFLNDHQHTWTSLSLTFPCVDFMEINFPKMINLTDLSISEWCIDEKDYDEGQAPFGIFNFGEQFPKLVNLGLDEESKSEGRRFFDLNNWFPENTTPVLSLKSLTLPPQYDAAILRRIGHIFPNISKLNLTVETPEVLKELWVTWPEIQILHIRIIADNSFRSISLDSIFTGIPDDSMKMLHDCQTNSVNTKAFKSSPYIGQLKKLKELLVRGPSYSDTFGSIKRDIGLKLNDVTVRLALANLKELNFLYISNNRHQISQSCIEDLCTGLELQRKTGENALFLFKYDWQKDNYVYNF